MLFGREYLALTQTQPHVGQKFADMRYRLRIVIRCRIA